MKAIYYRNTELVTAEQKAIIQKVYPDCSYNHFSELEWHADWNTALIDTVNILATIQCNQYLNEREEALVARIKKGLTPSRAYGKRYVEEALLSQLIFDAIILCKKESPDMPEILFSYVIKDIYRIYNIPFEAIFDKATKEYQQLVKWAVQEPKKIFDVKYNVSQDPHSAYREYTVATSEVPELNTYIARYKNKDIYKHLPFAGKVYYSTLSANPENHYWQIYVYDYADSDWAFQNVLNYLYDSLNK